MKIWVVFFFAILFVSCGEGTIVGKWKQKGIIADGTFIPQNRFELEIKEDGTYEMIQKSRRGSITSQKGKWTFDSNKKELVMTRENGFVETWTNVSVGFELKVMGRDFEVIFQRKY